MAKNYVIDVDEPITSEQESLINAGSPSSPIVGDSTKSYDAKDLSQRGAWSQEQFQTSNEIKERNKAIAYAKGVEGIQDFYGNNRKFANYEIERLYPTSVDYHDALVNSGQFKEGDKRLAAKMDNYVRTQFDRLDKKHNNYLYYGMDVLGLDKETSQKFADDMFGKDQNDIVDSGYRKWLPEYLRQSGDVEALKEFNELTRDSTRDQIQAMRLVDSMEYAHQNNLRYAFAKDPQTGNMKVNFVDAEGRAVDKPQLAVINASAGKAHLQEFNQSIQDNMMKENMMAFVSDTNKLNPEMKGKAYQIMMNTIAGIAKKNNKSYQATINDMKAAQGRPRMSDDEFYDSMYKVFDTQIKKNRSELEKGAIAHNVQFRDAVASQVGSALGLQSKTNIPVSENNLAGSFNQLAEADAYSTSLGIVAQMEASGMDITPDNIAKYLAMESAKGVREDDLLSRRIEENGKDIVQPLAKSIYGKYVVENRKQAEVIRKEKEQKKMVELKEQFKASDKVTTELRKSGRIFVGALKDGAKKDIADRILTRNGVVDIDMANAMGLKYDPATKIVEVEDRDDKYDAIETAGNSYVAENRRINANNGDHVIDIPSDRKTNPEQYGVLLTQYHNGIGTKEELMTMKAVLNDNDNIRAFVKANAMTGIDYDSLKGALDSNVPPRGIGTISKQDYKKFESMTELNKMFYTIDPKPNKSTLGQQAGLFSDTAKMYPNYTNSYLAGIPEDEKKMVDAEYSMSASNLSPSIQRQMSGNLLNLFNSGSEKMKKYAYYVAMKKANRKVK